MNNSSINYLYKTTLRLPDKPCISDGRSFLTFSQLFSVAYPVSLELKTGKKVNCPIAIYLPKGIDAIVSFAATLMSSNFYVPLDIKSPMPRISKILDNLQPAAIITNHELGKQLMEAGIQCQNLLFMDDEHQACSGLSIAELVESCANYTSNVIDTDPCYIMHTSGSTGQPKGVVVPHRGVLDYIEWAIETLHVKEQDVIGNQAPFFFDNSTLDIYLSWATGATLNIIPENEFTFPAALVDYLEKQMITFVFFVPAVLNSIAQFKALSSNKLPLLRMVVFAGEVMPSKHLAYWQTVLPEKRYVNLYGPTEITVDCTWFFVDRIYEPDESIPIGYPCKNTEILILNDKNQIAADGEQGELCVRGSSLALGYWNDPERSDAVFTQNPLHNHYSDKIYRTGDIVFRKGDGPIMFVGRKDGQIKHLGYRIELGEIENATMTLPDIIKCCVLYDQESKELVLHYEAEREIPVKELRSGLLAKIPSYMVPRKFFHYIQLPITPNGKIDRNTLKEKGKTRQ